MNGMLNKSSRVGVASRIHNHHVSVSYIPAPQMDVDHILSKHKKQYSSYPQQTEATIEKDNAAAIISKHQRQLSLSMYDTDNNVYNPSNSTTKTRESPTDALLKIDPEDYNRPKINQPETYFVLSSVVTVCFNLPLGMIALFCSWEAQKSFESGAMKRGRSKAKWAFCLSMTAMVLTVCVVMAVVFYVAYASVSRH